jgi:hypothetical protein
MLGEEEVDFMGEAMELVMVAMVDMVAMEAMELVMEGMVDGVAMD